MREVLVSVSKARDHRGGSVCVCVVVVVIVNKIESF